MPKVMSWYEQSDRKVRDMRDTDERAAVAAPLLEALPTDHRARKAFNECAATIELTHLVGDAELAAELTEAFLAGYRRSLRRCGSHFRP